MFLYRKVRIQKTTTGIRSKTMSIRRKANVVLAVDTDVDAGLGVGVGMGVDEDMDVGNVFPS